MGDYEAPSFVYDEEEYKDVFVSGKPGRGAGLLLPPSLKRSHDSLWVQMQWPVQMHLPGRDAAWVAGCHLQGYLHLILLCAGPSAAVLLRSCRGILHQTQPGTVVPSRASLGRQQ